MTLKTYFGFAKLFLLFFLNSISLSLDAHMSKSRQRTHPGVAKLHDGVSVTHWGLKTFGNFFKVEEQEIQLLFYKTFSHKVCGKPR